MSDDTRDDISEVLDGDVLGEEPGDDERPGTSDFPPDQPMGVEDPSLFGDDDLDTRALRRDVDDTASDPNLVLVDVVPDGEPDHEATLVADAELATSSGELSAEEAAIHLIDEEPID